jgi:hypothetical protein
MLHSLLDLLQIILFHVYLLITAIGSVHVFFDVCLIRPPVWLVALGEFVYLRNHVNSDRLQGGMNDGVVKMDSWHQEIGAPSQLSLWYIPGR